MERRVGHCSHFDVIVKPVRESLEDIGTGGCAKLLLK
jgi:hypothetical protein